MMKKRTVVLVRIDGSPMVLELPPDYLLEDKLDLKEETLEFYIDGKKNILANALLDGVHALVEKVEVIENKNEKKKDTEKGLFRKKEKVKRTVKVFMISPVRLRDLLENNLKIESLERNYEQEINILTEMFNKRLEQIKRIYENAINKLIEKLDESTQMAIDYKTQQVIEIGSLFDMIVEKVKQSTIGDVEEELKYIVKSKEEDMIEEEVEEGSENEESGEAE